MRFSWLSNSPWSPSGYGQQSRQVIYRLAEAGHEINAICYYGLEGGLMKTHPRVTCFPKRYHPYGNDIAISHTLNTGCQFLLSLMDVWVMNVEDYPPGFRWASWFPVDHDPIPGIIRAKLTHAWKRIAMSKFGVTQTHNAGLACEYIPHGVETSIIHPIDKKEAREKLGLPPDKWIVGTVAMNKGNPSRKNFVEHMQAYAAFHQRHPESFYFLQTDRGEGVQDMVNLPELGRSLGLIEGQDYGFCNQYQNILGFPVEYFSLLYSALDVHLLASAGEGFGIPTLEAQACGTPVIVGDWTASGELCLIGHKIDRKDAEPFWTSLASNQFKPHVRAIELALEAEYKHPTPQKARVKAVEQIKAEYDTDMLVETRWLPMLAQWAEEIEAEQPKREGAL